MPNVSFQTCVLGAQKCCLYDMVLLSTHNICFGWEISIFKFRTLFYIFRIMENTGIQGSHMLGKYLNLESFLEKSLKIKYVLKSTGKSLKGLEKSLIFFLFSVGQHC